MRSRTTLVTAIAALFLIQSARADSEKVACAGEEASIINGEEVSYGAGGVQLKGYLAYDAEQSGPRPGVLVVHEWWGLNDYARERARMLAAMGYTALAVDMYGDGKTAAHPQDAGKFSRAAMSDLAVAEERFLAARRLLEAHATTDSNQTAAIGYCFGGGVVLHMARIGTDLKGVASFHGNLAARKPAKAGAVSAEVLVLHGADDGFIPPEQITAFKQEMTDAGASFKFIAYPGAVHSFTNPGATAIGEKFDIPLAYHAEADARSWAELDTFLLGLFAD